MTVSTALDDLLSDLKVNDLPGTPAYAGVDLAMMNPATTTIPVPVDSALLAELRERSPGKDDQTLLEELARIELGFATLAEVQERSDLGDDEAREIALRAIRESRAESA